MPVLRPLTPEMKGALGKLQNLVAKFEELAEKSKSESLRDNEMATTYVDLVAQRYTVIKATSPRTQELKDKKDSTLALLKEHVGELSVLSFSKPADVASRLKQVDFDADSIDQVTKRMEQAGGWDDDLTTLITSAITSQSFLLCGDSHHHGHPSNHFHGHR